MTETDVRYAFARATGDISAPPDLLDRVRAGGHRRVVRRRALLAGGFAAAAAAVAAPVAWRGGTGPARPATRGDLAGDAGLLDRVRQVWRDTFGGDEPHVRWAGSTPAGPVALVAQPARSTSSTRSGGRSDELGFVATVGGALTALPEVSRVPAGAVGPLALLAGARRDVLVVVDAGQSVDWSADYRFDRAGRVARRFTPLSPGPGGVGVHRVDPAGGTVRFALRLGDGHRVALVDVADEAAGPTGVVAERLDRLLPGAGPAWTGAGEADAARWDVALRDGYLDPFGYHARPARSAWQIRGALPDGRRLVVQTLVLDGAARLFVLSGRAGETPAAQYGGVLGAETCTEVRDARGPLDILHVRLPQRRGVVVAAHDARLRYRVRTGAWLPVAGDAALLPDAATGLEVLSRGRRALTVSLP